MKSILGEKNNYILLFKILLFIWIVFIPMKTSIYQISYILIATLFLIYIFKEKKIVFFKNLLRDNKSILFAFALVLFSMTISNVLSSVTNFQSWRTEFHYVFRYMLIFVILLFFYKENFFTKKFLFVAIFSSLFIQGIDGIFQAIYHYDIIKGHNGSLSRGLTAATFNRNNFGMFMAIGASLSAGLIYNKNTFAFKKTDSIILAIFFMVFIFNLMFSYSRASWLFFITFSILFISLNYKKINKKQTFFLFIFIFIGIIIFYTNQTLLNRLNSLIQGSSSHRYEIWIHALSLIKEKIFFGYGLATYRTIGLKGYAATHNGILEIFLYLGFFGFIVYTNLLWKIINKIFKNKCTIQLALFFAFLVILQFDSSITKSITLLSSLTLFSFFIFSQINHEINKYEK